MVPQGYTLIVKETPKEPTPPHFEELVKRETTKASKETNDLKTYAKKRKVHSRSKTTSAQSQRPKGDPRR